MEVKISFEFGTEKEAKRFSKRMDALGWKNGLIKNGVYIQLLQENPTHVEYELGRLRDDVARASGPRYLNFGEAEDE